MFTQYARRSTRYATGVTAVEAGVAVAIIMGVFGMAMTYQTQVIKRAREVALQAELQSLRARLAFYEAVHKRRPASFRELVRADMARLRIGGGRIEDVRAGGDEVTEDPFGNPYRYQQDAGLVHSTTSGYETW